MGEIADLMLNGVLCEMCGEFIDFTDTDPVGYPRRCSECSNEHEEEKLYILKDNTRTKDFGVNMFWKYNSKGYTDKIIDAKLFYYEEAVAKVKEINSDLEMIPIESFSLKD